MPKSKDEELTIIGAESPEIIDNGMSNHNGSIVITGLKQDSFEHLIKKYGDEFTSISLFKCPLISDFTPIEGLKKIKSLSIFWNQRAVCLWDLSKNSQLTHIELDDFTRIHSLNDLATTTSLEIIKFGDKVWDSLVIDTLSPLKDIQTLKTLSFSAKKIEDKSLSAIAHIPNLVEVDFPINLFTTEQVAWLTARIGDKVKSSILKPTIASSHPYESNGKVIDTYIIGKRKPSLDSNKDKVRIDKYIANFETIVDRFRKNVSEAEPI